MVAAQRPRPVPTCSPPTKSRSVKLTAEAEVASERLEPKARSATTAARTNQLMIIPYPRCRGTPSSLFSQAAICVPGQLPMEHPGLEGFLRGDATVNRTGFPFVWKSGSTRPIDLPKGPEPLRSEADRRFRFDWPESCSMVTPVDLGAKPSASADHASCAAPRPCVAPNRSSAAPSTWSRDSFAAIR